MGQIGPKILSKALDSQLAPLEWYNPGTHLCPLPIFSLPIFLICTTCPHLHPTPWDQHGYILFMRKWCQGNLSRWSQVCLLGGSEPVFSCMHVSLLASLCSPLDWLCPFIPATNHHNSLVFRRISHNVVATPTHVKQLMQRWKATKEAAVEAEQTTKLKIPSPLHDLIFHIKIPGADSGTKADEMIFTLQLTPCAYIDMPLHMNTMGS